MWMLIDMDAVSVTSCNWAPTKTSGNMVKSSSGIRASFSSGEKQPMIGESSTRAARSAATVRGIVVKEWFGYFTTKEMFRILAGD